MPNTVTINFIECDTAPAQGYNLKWRVAGSGDPYTDEGNFSGSPAFFIDNVNPEGTCYEGTLQAVCTESGESGEFVGDAIPWNTTCEESGTNNYTIELAAPCSGIISNYLIDGGVEGDIIKVRATFTGIMTKIIGDAVRSDLSISSVDGVGESQSSACFTDSSPHSFSITADCTITIPAGGSTVVNLSAVVNNSSSSMAGVVVSIIEVNGSPVTPISASGCAGNSSTGISC